MKYHFTKIRILKAEQYIHRRSDCLIRIVNSKVTFGEYCQGLYKAGKLSINKHILIEEINVLGDVLLNPFPNNPW